MECQGTSGWISTWPAKKSPLYNYFFFFSFFLEGGDGGGVQGGAGDDRCVCVIMLPIEDGFWRETFWQVFSVQPFSILLPQWSNSFIIIIVVIIIIIVISPISPIIIICGFIATHFLL